MTDTPAVQPGDEVRLKLKVNGIAEFPLAAIDETTATLLVKDKENCVVSKLKIDKDSILEKVSSVGLSPSLNYEADDLVQFGKWFFPLKVITIGEKMAKCAYESFPGTFRSLDLPKECLTLCKTVGNRNAALRTFTWEDENSSTPKNIWSEDAFLIREAIEIAKLLAKKNNTDQDSIWFETFFKGQGGLLNISKCKELWGDLL